MELQLSDNTILNFIFWGPKGHKKQYKVNRLHPTRLLCEQEWEEAGIW